MSIYMSRDARRVVDHLEVKTGLEVQLGEDLFDIEVCCSQFFPNHICGVVDKCLRGKRPVRNLMRAQNLGWQYFKKPVRDFLEARISAHQPTQRSLDDIVPFAPKTYNIVVATLLPHDMNRAEANILLFEIPKLGDRHRLLESIQICKRQRARSIAYLRGVMEREKARREADRAELEKARVPVWEPGELEAIETALGLDDWESRKGSIESVKGIKRGKT